MTCCIFDGGNKFALKAASSPARAAIASRQAQFGVQITQKVGLGAAPGAPLGSALEQRVKNEQSLAL